MPSSKERYQNPVVGDTVTLRTFIFNQNAYANVQSVVQVEIYFLDPTARTPENPDGRTLFKTIPGDQVVQDDVGQYHVVLELTDPSFVIGQYRDVWTLQFESEVQPGKVEYPWAIYPDMWYTSPTPVVYEFQFRFQPNRFRHGEKKFLRIEIVPQVPTASDLGRYYENLATVSSLRISIEQQCGPCLPEETDLRLVVDKEPVTFREKRFGYYQLDTRDLHCGIYNVWFEVQFGDNIYISDKGQIQIYE